MLVAVRSGQELQGSVTERSAWLVIAAAGRLLPESADGDVTLTWCSSVILVRNESSLTGFDCFRLIPRALGVLTLHKNDASGRALANERSKLTE